MKTINIKVIDKCPAVESMTGSAVSDNTYQFKFKFDDEWQDGAKTFLLVNPWGDYTPFVMENDEITIDIPYDGRLSVGVIQGKTATSRPCIIEFKPSIKKLMGEQIPPPPDDVYAQIMSIINALESAKLNPAPKTDDMTEPVGRDENGQLWAAPMGGGGGGSSALWYPTVTDGVISFTKSTSVTPPEPADIRGPKGDKGDTGEQGPKGDTGDQGIQGPQGIQGLPGADGTDGKSAYEIAVANGFVGTEEEWLASLVGSPGAPGKTAYEYAQDGGYTGTEEEFAAKMAEEMPEKLPNPHALTFSGAVTGTYDGSEAVTVEIPSGGGNGAWKLINSITVEEAVRTVSVTTDADGAPFSVQELIFRCLLTCAESSRQNATIYILKDSQKWPVIGNLNIVKNKGYYGPSEIIMRIQGGKAYAQCVYSDYTNQTPTLNNNIAYNPATIFQSAVPYGEFDAITGVVIECTKSAVAFDVGSIIEIYGR